MYACNLSRYVRYHIPWMSYHSIIPLQYVGTSSISSFNINEITFNHRITAHHLQTRTYQQVFGFPNILTQTPSKYFQAFKKQVFFCPSRYRGEKTSKKSVATSKAWWPDLVLWPPEMIDLLRWLSRSPLLSVFTWGWLTVGYPWWIEVYRYTVYRLFFNAGDCKVVEIVIICFDMTRVWYLRCASQ